MEAPRCIVCGKRHWSTQKCPAMSEAITEEKRLQVAKRAVQRTDSVTVTDTKPVPVSTTRDHQRHRRCHASQNNEPWMALGMSRRTWYRYGKPAGPVVRRPPKGWGSSRQRVLGDRPMTNAEIQRRYRARRAARHRAGPEPSVRNRVILAREETMMADTLRNRRAESALADAIIQCLYSAPPDHWSAANVLLALLTQEIAFLPDALRERMIADIEGGALRTRVEYLEARVRAARRASAG